VGDEMPFEEYIAHVQEKRRLHGMSCQAVGSPSPKRRVSHGRPQEQSPRY
jgi:hypothetical protein